MNELALIAEADQVVAAFRTLVTASEAAVTAAFDQLEAETGLDVNARARARIAVGLLHAGDDDTEYWLDALSAVEQSGRRCE